MLQTVVLLGLVLEKISVNTLFPAPKFRNDMVYYLAFMPGTEIYRLPKVWEYTGERFIIIMMKTKHQVHIMVFSMITSDGVLMPPYIFQRYLRFSTEACIKCLAGRVQPWTERVAVWKLCVWQKDYSIPNIDISLPFTGPSGIRAWWGIEINGRFAAEMPPGSGGSPSGGRAATLTTLFPLYSIGPCCPI